MKLDIEYIYNVVWLHFFHAYPPPFYSGEHVLYASFNSSFKGENDKGFQPTKYGTTARKSHPIGLVVFLFDFVKA